MLILFELEDLASFGRGEGDGIRDWCLFVRGVLVLADVSMYSGSEIFFGRYYIGLKFVDVYIDVSYDMDIWEI